MTINSPAAVDNRGTLTIESGQLTVNGDVTNQGDVTIAAGASLVANGAGRSYTQTQGTTKVTGNLTAATVIINGGMLQGTGNVTGKVTNNGGVLKPGDAPGTITITGSYSQGDGGTLLEEIGGTATTDFGRTVVSGDGDLSGTLDIMLVNGFIPTEDERFVIMVFGGQRNGEFTTVNSPIFGDSLTFIAVYDAHDVILEVAKTPEPSLGALIAGALILLSALRCRSRLSRGKRPCLAARPNR